ncbi:hypothetical protein X946_5317 [Burkholderia sp. ABCPW 111]|nr:hypothetical protein X946_5317 [Burkholderia sp. ABCPW 111]
MRLPDAGGAADVEGRKSKVESRTLTRTRSRKGRGAKSLGMERRDALEAEVRSG